ncbi:MAG: lysine--tRNA ligase [Myxococcales bacterium]|nr:lysine--tRNA ligase [Myxococcales bacterium]
MSEREQDVRRERLEAARAAGIDPFPARVGSRTPISELRARYDDQDAEALDAAAPEAALVGRVRAVRSFGKLLFLDVVEEGTGFQVSARKGETPAETFAFLRGLDVGDFVHVAGRIWRTKKGELSLAASEASLLAKSLRPLPEKWHGLVDVETRLRQRHLDLLGNPRAREVAILRSRMVSALRRFLDGRGFLEVETPVLQPLYGGAAARPFNTHHETYDQPLYLRISDELYLKRLVIGGLDRVYEIGHDFRNEGVSRKHNPEFTMLECYQAYADFEEMMRLTEAMVQETAQSVLGTLEIVYQEQKIDLSGSWPRVRMDAAIREATGVDVLAAPDLAALRKAISAAGHPVPEAASWAKLVDELFSDHVEPELVQPTFVTHHPAALSPLAKRSPDDPRVVERFEVFVAGFELGNAFSELNDPDDQRARFEEQSLAASAGDDETQPVDEDFLAALEAGMPPTGGFGLGVDRLAMLLADTSHIREVILFPHLRPESG